MLELMRKHSSGWIIKILFGIIIVVFVIYFGASNPTGSKDPVLAYVDGQPIAARDFERAYGRIVDGMRRQNPGLSAEDLQNPQIRQGILNQMITSRLLMNEAERLGIAVSDAEVRTGIARIEAFQGPDGQFHPEIYKAVLSENRLTPTEFEAEFRDNLLTEKMRVYAGLPVRLDEAQAREWYDWSREQMRVDYVLFPSESLADMVQVGVAQVADFYEKNKDSFVEPAQASMRFIDFTVKSLAARQSVGDDEIKAYYDSHQQSFTRREEVKARHILVVAPADAPEADQQKAKARIDELARSATAANFAELAKKNSQDGSAAQGGELGWFGRGVMVKPFEDAAFALKKGEVSTPVRTQFGWHLILAEDRRVPGLMTFDEARDEVRSRLAEAAEKVNELMDRTLDQLASGMKLDAIAKEIDLPVQDSGLMTQEAMQQRFGMKPEAVKTLFQLPQGMSTQTPLAVDGGYIVAEKTQDQPEAPMSLDQVKPRIVGLLKAEGAAKLAEEKAAQALASLRQGKDPKELGLTVLRSAPFNRRGMVSGLGVAQQMAQAAFAAKGKEWLAQPFQVPAGFIVARPAERIAPPADAWNKEKEFWVAEISQQYGQELFQAYVADLRDKAKDKIRIERPDLLN